MTRALVLGGGGPVGIAWEAGLIAGLAEHGVHFAEADYTLGTSAGSFVGSQLAMQKPVAEIARAILAEAERPRRPAPEVGGQPAEARAAPNFGMLIQKMQELTAGQRDPQEVRREIGAFALAAQTVDEETFIRGFGRSLSEAQAEAWPERNFACTAVDAETGEFVIWTAQSRVGLARAVASSCAVPGVFPPININGRRYIDGGMRSATNADLAKGHELVVVLAMGASASADEARRQGAMGAEIAALESGGARVELIVPNEASRTAFGFNAMDTRVRPAACAAGLEQGRAMAEALKGVWG
jgi:NTE family protein